MTALVKRPLTAIAILTFGLTGCSTLQQIDTALDEPEAAAEAPGPAVVASVDCHELHFEISGYPEGTGVNIGIGSQPPWGFVVGVEHPWGFRMIDGGATGTIPVIGWEAVHWFDAAIDIATPGGDEVRVFDQRVDCGPQTVEN